MKIYRVFIFWVIFLMTSFLVYKGHLADAAWIAIIPLLITDFILTHLQCQNTTPQPTSLAQQDEILRPTSLVQTVVQTIENNLPNKGMP